MPLSEKELLEKLATLIRDLTAVVDELQARKQKKKPSQRGGDAIYNVNGLLNTNVDPSHTAGSSHIHSLGLMHAPFSAGAEGLNNVSNDSTIGGDIAALMTPKLGMAGGARAKNRRRVTKK